MNDMNDMNDMNNCILESEEIVTERAHGAATNTSPAESASSTYWRDRYPANYQSPPDVQANYMVGRGRVVVEALLAEIDKLVSRPFARYDPAVVTRARKWLRDANKPTCDGKAEQAPNSDAETYSRSGDYYQCPFCKSLLGHCLLVKDMEETWESHRRVCTARRKQYIVSGPGVHLILRAYEHLLCEQDSDSVLAEMFVSAAEALQRDHPTLSVEENIGYTHKTR